MHNSTLLAHSLALEFPNLADKIKALKQSDSHFSKLLGEHDALDKLISQDELGVKAMDDVALHALKQKRALIKDELYQLLTAH